MKYFSQAEMHYNDFTAPPIIICTICMDASFSYIFKNCIQNMIIGCKLATTEYGAETFFPKSTCYVPGGQDCGLTEGHMIIFS